MKKIVLATGNKNKIKEYQNLFSSLEYEFISSEDIGISLDAVIEDGLNFKQNALIKARAIASQVSYPVIADDSGITINALYGFPGIFSHRFMEDYSYREKNNAIMHMLENCSNRRASFHCAIALVYSNKEFVFEGVARGEITHREFGIDGFGYDPIFFSYQLNKTFAEASLNEKNTFSHRAKASKKLFEFLKKNKDII